MKKKTIIRVVSCEEETEGEPVCNPSLGSNGDCDWLKPQPEVGLKGDKEERSQVDTGNHIVQETTTVVSIDESKDPIYLSVTVSLNGNQPDVSSTCNFQDQLDEIDGELTQYDTMREDTEVEVADLYGGVGSRIVGSMSFLKNCFLSLNLVAKLQRSQVSQR